MSTSEPTLSEVAKALSSLGDVVHLSWSPGLEDFRHPQRVTLRANGVDIPVPTARLPTFVGLLRYSLFAPGRTLLGWDLKPLFTYLRYQTGLPVEAACRLYDLKLLESYCGVRGTAPTSLRDAGTRLADVMGGRGLRRVNDLVFTPLTVEVVPALEVHGLVADEALYHSSYAIEGSVNGRMVTRQEDWTFSPHHLPPDQRSRFRAGHERRFLVFDYLHMEVAVLAWLSGDERLLEAVNSADAYAAIAKVVMGASRGFVKKTFLPVMFGAGPTGLHERVGVARDLAARLIGLYQAAFPVAFRWLEQQESATADRLGRSFAGDRSPTSLRNAAVQAPASLICLERLVALYRDRPYSLDIVASVHDGYVCTVDDLAVTAAVEAGRAVLEAPSPLAPGLALRAAAAQGPDWGNLKKC